MFASFLSFRPARTRLAASAIFVLLLVTALGCAAEVASQEPVPSAPIDDDTSVLAVIDGVEITVNDLREFVGMELGQLEFQYRSQRHTLLEQGLEQVLRDRLLTAEAESRGVTVDEMIASEVGEVEVTDAQVVAFYESNQARLQGRTLAELRPAIRQFLGEQRREEVITGLTDTLAEARSVERRLEPFRADVASAGHPAFGPANAPVTLVEFSDFECPYCGGFFQTIERIKAEYGDQVRVVFRQFPLRQIHPNAQKAAEASLCAADQDKFWELHDLMFQEQASLDVASLQDKATRLGLDMEAFNACLSSDQYAEQVQADLEAGGALGVTGTPALFVNGRPVEGGAVPFEMIAEVIDDELERAGR